MAKPHKFAWNGLDVTSTLSIEQLANMTQRAATGSTGDLWNGKHKVVSTRSATTQIEYRINDFLISFSKFMIFYVDFATVGEANTLKTSIDWYLTTQTTVAGFVPVSAKKMVAHHTYMQFVRNLAEQVRAADPGATVTVREGIALIGAPTTAQVPQAPVAMTVAAPVQDVPGPVQPAPPQAPPAPPVLRRPPPPPAAAAPIAQVPGWTPPVVAPTVPPVAPAVPAAIDDGDDEFEATRIAVPVPAAGSWSLLLPGGTELPLTGAILFGRNPAPRTDYPSAALIAVTDSDKSVSKTHAVITLVDGVPVVTDLRSTNGTLITNEVKEAESAPAGQGVTLEAGWRVELGNYSVLVNRN